MTHRCAASLARTAEAAIVVDLRGLQADRMGQRHDLKGLGAAWPAVVKPLSHGACQALGRVPHGQGGAGLACDSVRHPRGQCVAVAKARAVGRIGLHWGGRAITQWFDQGASHAL